ncbi:hypothetical protein ACTJKE_09455 [Ensifer sp. 22521]|uniref:hypothetical protein n=1 Tax=Ensifer sp. 22521 TaxID=3453935 RepID=UPI003F862063
MNIAPTPAFSAALYAACARYGGWHCEPRSGVIRRTEPDAPSPIRVDRKVPRRVSARL